MRWSDFDTMGEVVLATRKPRRNAQHGFSLVELMVALVIGLIILVVVVRIFTTGRATYQSDQALSDIQENARFANDFLSPEIRMAGYLGCNTRMNTSQVHDIVSGASGGVSQWMTGGLQGYTYTCTSGCTGALTEWTPPLPSAFFKAGEVMPNTDVVSIQRGSDLNTHVTGMTAPSNANLQILGSSTLAGQLQAGDIMMVSDCKHADIYYANSVSTVTNKMVTISQSSNGNTQPHLPDYFGDDATLFELLARAYYIGTDPTTHAPALFRKEMLGLNVTTPPTGEELVPNIESMKLLYGVDTDSDEVPNLYTTAGNVTSWQKVVAVQLGLLVRSNDIADTRTQTVSAAAPLSTVLPDTTPFTIPADKRWRKVFDTTIQVRNH